MLTIFLLVLSSFLITNVPNLNAMEETCKRDAKEGLRIISRHAKKAQADSNCDLEIFLRNILLMTREYGIQGDKIECYCQAAENLDIASLLTTLNYVDILTPEEIDAIVKDKSQLLSNQICSLIEQKRYEADRLLYESLKELSKVDKETASALRNKDFHSMVSVEEYVAYIQAVIKKDWPTLLNFNIK
jgi:hypothetical protein